MYTKITECLACGCNELTPVLDLGNQPLANSYTTEQEQNLPEFELKINRCPECYHVQLSVAVDPDLMFKDYLYVSGTSKTMLEHFKWFAGFTKEYSERVLGSPISSTVSVLDIGCNDGSQLDAFKAIGCDTSGIDPAENLHPLSSKNHNVTCGYFDEKYVDSFKSTNLSPKIITAQNVFAHNYDPLTFMKNVKRLMSSDTLFFVQTSQANMILNNEFDTIYHEHISFYNIKSMKALCDRADLELIDVVKCPLHGTSYIFIIAEKGISRPYNIDNLINMEQIAGLYSEITYEIYREKCYVIKERLEEEVEYFVENGYKLVGYGAAAKGNTLLNFSGIKLDYIIDDNPLKHNHYTPGSAVKIVPITILDEFSTEDKILFIPLAWNFFSEITSKIKSKRNIDHDRFMTYFPFVQVL